MKNVRRHALACMLLTAAGLTFAAGAQAQLRAAKTCTSFAQDLNATAGEIPEPIDVCYSGFSCSVGMRGDWMDFTDEVTVTPLGSNAGLRAEARLGPSGSDQYGASCAPSASKSREGFTVVKIVASRGHGRLRVNAVRPGPMGVGRHSSHFDFEMRDGSRYLELFPRDVANKVGRVGQANTITLFGRGLQSLRLKSQPAALSYSTASTARKQRSASAGAAIRSQVSAPTSAALLSKTTAVRTLAGTATALAATPTVPTPEVTLMGATQSYVFLKIKFDREGFFSLGDYLEFADGEPDINRDFGWPLIFVSP